MADANAIAAEWERRERERESLRPPRPPQGVARAHATLGRLSIFDAKNVEVETTAPCHVRIDGPYVIAEFPSGERGIYSLAPGSSAVFEPVDAGE